VTKPPLSYDKLLSGGGGDVTLSSKFN